MTSSNVYWYQSQKSEPSQPLSKKIRTTVAVVGGGMAGLTCAKTFADAGESVVLLEKDFCGAGASGKTSGFITPDSEIELSSLVSNYGPAKAKQLWEFVLGGVNAIRENIQHLNIACDYRIQDSLFIANSAKGFLHVKREHEARKNLGYTSTLFPSNKIADVIGSQKYFGAVRYPDTFGMNAYRYCLALRDHLVSQGVQIYEQMPALKISDHTITTPNGEVHADHIIVACDRFIPDFGVFQKEIYHVQTFLGMTQPLSNANIQNLFPGNPLMVWDTNLVYNYFRVTEDNRLLVGGGDLLYTYARNVARSTKRFEKRLRAYLSQRFPFLNITFEYIWPGMLGVSKDLLPIMGPDPRNPDVWYIGAATGLPWASALGRYSAERILHNTKEWDQTFSPNRKFVIGSRMQSLLTTPLTYALSHGITKYL